MKGNLLSVVPVPFRLRAEQVTNGVWCYRESPDGYSRQMNLYGATLLFFGTVLPSACVLAGLVALNVASLVVAVGAIALCTGVGGWFIAKAARARGSGRVLCVDINQASVQLQTVDAWGVPSQSRSCKLGDLRLVVSRVVVRTGSPLIPGWRGWAQIVYVENEFIVLACDRERSVTEEMARAFPGGENARVESREQEMVGDGLIRARRERR